MSSQHFEMSSRHFDMSSQHFGMSNRHFEKVDILIVDILTVNILMYTPLTLNFEGINLVFFCSFAEVLLCISTTSMEE